MKEGKNVGLTGQGNMVETVGKALEQVIRKGVRHILADALDLEASDYIEPCRHFVGPDGSRPVRRSGTPPEQDLVTGIGPIRVKQPRVRDGRKGCKFTSAILPPYLRRAAASVDALIPWLYLKGVSTGDFSEALQAIPGPRAKGLGASNVVRLKDSWRKEHEVWEKLDLSGKRYAYWWVDGIYFNVRLQTDRCCLLVLIGATGDGGKEPVAVWDGWRESKLSWLTVLNDMKKRGLTEGPGIAVGDGAMGFWAALAEEYPECREQRCWVHKTANILDRMPKSVQPDAGRAILEIYMAPKRATAMKACKAFVKMYESRYSKAVNCFTKDKDVLFSFYDFPAEHWVDLRTTNPIESTFATVRLRTRRTKGCGSPLATLTRVFQLVRAAERRWRRLNGHQLSADVISGVEFVDGDRKKKMA